jgi:hypothetical protein
MRIAAAWGPVVLVLAAVGAASCASTGSSGDVAFLDSPKKAARADEIVRLHTRSGDVAVVAGGGAGVVRLYDPSGAFMQTATIDSLRATHPELFEVLTRATASAPFFDARLDVPARAETPVAPGVPGVPGVDR